MSRRICSTRSGSSASRPFHDPFFRGTVGQVENLGDGIDAAGLLEGLADDVGKTMLQSALDFLDHLGIGLLHVGDALDHFDLLLARETDENLAGLLRRQMGQDQGDGLGMFILNEGEEIFALGLSAERRTAWSAPAASPA
jgi:hypothetical protein